MRLSSHGMPPSRKCMSLPMSMRHAHLRPQTLARVQQSHTLARVQGRPSLPARPHRLLEQAAAINNQPIMRGGSQPNLNLRGEGSKPNVSKHQPLATSQSSNNSSTGPDIVEI